MQARPERLAERIAAAPPGLNAVVIDEIQKTPQLLDVVHGLVEQRRNLRFVFTGSSARRLRHGAANLLGGRLVAMQIPPFMAAELGEGFTLCRALEHGLVPLLWQAADPQATLAAYASLYLQEEVQAEALVRQIGDFTRFLEVISFSQGSQLDLASLGRAG
jgi:predicted AAA+ superfamily ATPase